MFFSSIVQKFGVLIAWAISTSLIFFRYLFFAGLAYGTFYVWKKNKLIRFKIQKQFPKDSQIRTESKYSLFSATVFGVFAFFVFWMNTQGWSHIYRDIHLYGYGYLFLSWVMMLLFHDTYFYWTHRWMHHPRLFKLFHKVHHYSHNPTPWAAFAFHPFEALVEFGVLPLAVFIIPMHPVVLFAWSIWMITWNVIGHLGYEIFPKRFVNHPFFKWFNTSTHHNLHHERSQGNYGLYFNIWDNWMNTNQKNYKEVFTVLKENQVK
jgi:Delta7-sterol 5-desaturase